MTGIVLRPATPADSEFCFGLHKAAMGGYITAIWGWDEQRQRGFHARGFDPARWQIITAGGADIGMLHVEYRPGEIYLSRVEILPGHQGRGVGTRLISPVVTAAPPGPSSGEPGEGRRSDDTQTSPAPSKPA